MFRASNDGGQSLEDKINLSNTIDSISDNAEIAAVGNNVFVSWWEHYDNSIITHNEPVLRVSNGNGQTFGPLLKLSTNGGIGQGG